MALDFDTICAKSEVLKRKYAERDGRMADVAAIRRGEMERIAPGLFPDAWPKSVVADVIGVAAQDLAEVMAPLPSFNAPTAKTASDAARAFADKRTKIANYYISHSDLETQMLAGADRYLTFGHMPIYVEADFEAMCPRITVESPVGSYPEFDRWGRVKSHVRRLTKTVDDICADYPEFESQMKGNQAYGTGRSGSAQVDLVRYCDADQIVLFTYGAQNNRVLLRRAPNPLGKTPVVIAQRPSFDEEQRGQFDHAIWIQVARAYMALLSLEAAEKAVTAPLFVPSDVQEVTFGADALNYTASPEKVRRLPLELPQSAFAELAQLGNEARLTARYPEGRSGNIDASVVTGRGVQQLLAGFDTQVKTGQTIFRRVLADVVSLCFEMDEKLWPTVEKSVRGTSADAPYEIRYKPGRDIRGDYTIDVSYGMAAGLDPNRAVVLLLQLRGDHGISRRFMLQQMPFSIDVNDELAEIDVEETRDSLKQGLNGLAAAIPQLAAAGQNPMDVVTKLADVISQRQKGTPIEDAVLKAFTPPKTPDSPESGQPGEQPGAPGGQNPTAPLVPGLVPGQEGMGPGGAPDLQMLLAGLSPNGKPQMSSVVSRRLPA